PQQRLRRMHAAQPPLHFLIEDAVIDGGRLPAHPADHANGLHVFTPSPPRSGGEGWAMGWRQRHSGAGSSQVFAGTVSYGALLASFEGSFCPHRPLSLTLSPISWGRGNHLRLRRGTDEAAAALGAWP